MACQATYRSTPWIQTGEPQATEAERGNLTTVPSGRPPEIILKLIPDGILITSVNISVNLSNI